MNQMIRVFESLLDSLSHVADAVVVGKALAEIDRVVVARQTRELDPHVLVADSTEHVIQIVVFCYVRWWCRHDSFE